MAARHFPVVKVACSSHASVVFAPFTFFVPAGSMNLCRRYITH